MNKIMLNSAIVTCLLISTSAQADGLTAPAGWKLPRQIKNSRCDRSKSDLLSIKADFDGDGKEDFSQLLTKINGSEIGLWVKLASEKNPILVANGNSTDEKHDMGIGLVAPGTYKTLCGKGYVECKKESNAQLKLELPAIDFFGCDGHNRFFYWNKEKKKFIGEWMSVPLNALNDGSNWSHVGMADVGLSKQPKSQRPL